MYTHLHAHDMHDTRSCTFAWRDGRSAYIDEVFQGCDIPKGDIPPNGGVGDKGRAMSSFFQYVPDVSQFLSVKRTVGFFSRRTVF